MLSAGEVGADSLKEFKANVDLGDHLFVHGPAIRSRRGELSIFASPSDDVPAWQIASKALRPLPKTFTTADGEEVTLSEESRIRRRHLDMIMRPAAREMVRTRADVVWSLRDYFHREGFIEIETPMLQNITVARPHARSRLMNAYDTELYLRIAPELFLKRAVVGGIEKVFEITVFSATRAQIRRTRSSPCWRPTRPTAPTTRWPPHSRLHSEVRARRIRSEVVTLADGTKYDLSGQWDSIRFTRSCPKL